MFLRISLFFFLTFNIHANSQIEEINNFLDTKRFSYEQISDGSSEVVSGKLILDPLQIYLEINNPYRESYLIGKKFITYNDLDFSQQRTFEYSEDDYPIIKMIAKKKIPSNDDSINILELEDGLYLIDKLTEQVFKFVLMETGTLIIQFKDNMGFVNSIYLNKLL